MPLDRAVAVVVLTSNTALAVHPGNVFLPATVTRLPTDSVANVTQLVTLDRRDVEGDRIGDVPAHLMADVDAGLRLVLDL